jgi:glycosyltransferase involved in cell wall biosynthesis
MRIGFSTSVIQRGQSGVAQYVFGLLRAFFSQGFHSSHQFVLYVLEADAALFEFALNQVQIRLVPERYRPPANNILWHQLKLPRQARQDRLDVLHIPSYRRLLRTGPCPRVGTIHDLAPFRVAGKYDWQRMLYGRLLVPWLARRQDRIIAISQNTAQDIKEFLRIAPHKVSLIYNGISHDRFFPGNREEAKKAVAERHGLRRPFFLYVARLEHPAKNHVRLISAFEMFKAATHSDWQLVFGGGDWHGAPAIRAAIARSSCAAEIRCLGFVADAQLPDLYRAAQALVYPSLYEGFGLPPLEAMACGCPVISSTRGALGEVVGQAAALVEPEDIHALARQLHSLANDVALGNRLRAAGFAQAAKFDWKRTALETMKVYESAWKAPSLCERALSP